MAEKTIQGIKYLLDASKRTAEVIANNYTGDICIPKKVVDNNIQYNVTSIGDHAFRNCSALTSITIPNSVTSIGSYAFSGCSSLPIENNLRYADTYLVEAVDKTLSTYSIKEGTKWIGSTAFSDCSSLKSITIPNSVTSIGQSAFRNCKQLNSIKIPDSVKYIGYWAFAHCDQLIDVQIGHNFTGIGDVFDGDGRPTPNGKNFGRPLKETERKKRNEPIIKAIELFLNALNTGNKKPHDYEYLLGQTIRQYEPSENHQHVSIGAWNHWQNQASTDEDIRQFQYTWKYKKKQSGQSEKFNTHFIQEHTTPVADIKKELKDLKKNNNICFKSIEDRLEKMHISRILKTEDKAIKKNSGRGLDFEDIANDCYQGAGIEFQCSKDKIGYEAFKRCDNLQAITIGTNQISIPDPKIDKLIKGEKITISN